MKKIYKLTNWGDVNFTEANVLDKSHWFIKALDTALAALEIGSYSMVYNSINSIRLVAEAYGAIDLYRPTVGSGIVYCSGVADTTQPYIVYVDADNKELVLCSQDGTPKEATVSFASNIPFNCARGIVNTLNGDYVCSNGGGVRLKFKDGGIAGGSFGTIERSMTSEQYFNVAQIASPFHENSGVLSVPFGQSVSIDYHRLANATYGSRGLSGWDGSFFESVFLCDKYYAGALVSADNTKFIFNGLLFLVDNATDIGTIETTV